METKRVKRKIAAILSADVVGYSRLMGDDEAATVEMMVSCRETIFSLIEEYNGHVVDSPGDNILSEFPSVVDAAQCAVEIQQVMKAKNADLPEDRRMAFRIGINLGDVIEEEDKIYGDGVNIAARIEALADPGGICISGSAYEQIESKLALGYISIGDHALKNINRPVHVYKIPLDPKDAGKAGGGSRHLKTRPARPAEKKPNNPNDYYLSGFICIAVAFGLPLLAYFIARVAPEAFWPIAGAGAMLLIIGAGLIFCGKFIERRMAAADRHHNP